MEDLLNSIGWLLSIATAVGNGFVIFLVAKNRRLHSSANWFVLSLAVADFGVGITFFHQIIFVFTRWLVTPECTWHSSGFFLTLRSQIFAP